MIFQEIVKVLKLDAEQTRKVSMIYNNYFEKTEKIHREHKDYKTLPLALKIEKAKKEYNIKILLTKSQLAKYTEHYIYELAIDLVNCHSKIVGKWGEEQNNNSDSLVNIWLFDCYNDLNDYIIKCDLTLEERGYVENRWFSAHEAIVDEYLFCRNKGIIPNLNTKDQNWDIEIEIKNLKYDIKSTRLVTKVFSHLSYSGIIQTYLKNPDLLAKYYYIKQSKDVRNAFQNRIFIVHCSKNNEKYLRTIFKTKNNIINEYVKYFTNENTIPLILSPFWAKGKERCGIYYDIIFIVELKNNMVGYQFASDPIKKLRTINIVEQQ